MVKKLTTQKTLIHIKHRVDAKNYKLMKDMMLISIVIGVFVTGILLVAAVQVGMCKRDYPKKSIGQCLKVGTRYER